MTSLNNFPVNFDIEKKLKNILMGYHSDLAENLNQLYVPRQNEVTMEEENGFDYIVRTLEDFYHAIHKFK